MQLQPITRQMAQFYLEGLRIGAGKAYYRISTLGPNLLLQRTADPFLPVLKDSVSCVVYMEE